MDKELRDNMKSKEYPSKMKFINYVVDHIEYRSNLDFDENEVSIDFDIRPEFMQGENDKDLIVVLDVDIFKDAEKNNYPFEMSLRLVGYFKVEDSDEKDKFKTNALAIMYPYVRSIVTSYTANANVNPLILPLININAFIESRKNQKNK